RRTGPSGPVFICVRRHFYFAAFFFAAALVVFAAAVLPLAGLSPAAASAFAFHCLPSKVATQPVGLPSFSDITYWDLLLRLKRTMAALPSGSVSGASSRNRYFSSSLSLTDFSSAMVGARVSRCLGN